MRRRRRRWEGEEDRLFTVSLYGLWSVVVCFVSVYRFCFFEGTPRSVLVLWNRAT